MDKVPGRGIQVMVLCINSAKLPVGAGTQGIIGNIVSCSGIRTGNNGAALAVAGQETHGTHTGGLKKQAGSKTGFFK